MVGVPKSEEVIQRIISIKDKLIAVRGNREKYILEGMPKIVHDEKIEISPEQLQSQELQKKELSESSIQFISNLPKEIIYEVEKKKIYIAHYPMNTDGSLKKHIKRANEEECEEMFLGINTDIYLYGHTHTQVFNTKNNKFYINPGALGCPGKTNFAPYGIISISKGKIKYEQLNATYNVKEVIDDIEKIKFSGYKGVLKLFYGMNDEQN